MNAITTTKRTYQCRAFHMETFIAYTEIEAQSLEDAMEQLKSLEAEGELYFQDYCDAQPSYEWQVEGEEGQLTQEEPEQNLYAQQALVRMLLEALEAQAMADADPEASERKGYYDLAKELRIAALTKAGRPAY